MLDEDRCKELIQEIEALETMNEDLQAIISDQKDVFLAARQVVPRLPGVPSTKQGRNSVDNLTLGLCPGRTRNAGSAPSRDLENYNRNERSGEGSATSTHPRCTTDGSPA
jgi:hypothetical protein